jgi:hypothetical protein
MHIEALVFTSGWKQGFQQVSLFVKFALLHSLLDFAWILYLVDSVALLA